jgi:hypothetical protein
VILIREAPHEDITRVIQPFDYVYEFALYKIPNAHGFLLLGAGALL